MRPPLFVRPLSTDEQRGLETALRASNAFTLRRAQVLLASARGLRSNQIASHLGCSDQAVRNIIRAFAARGLDCLRRTSSRPKSVQPLFDQARLEALRALLHRAPRDFGQPTNLWTLALAAQVCPEQGLTPHLVSEEMIRTAMRRLGVGCKRAKHWITSPDPQYAAKKSDLGSCSAWLSNAGGPSATKTKPGGAA
jgi:transposase